MRIILQVASWAALAATILAPLLFLGNRFDLDQTKWLILAATAIWFVATPLWMGRKVGSAA
ncbi:MAG: hypothetical protein KJ000_05585 [Pirellulaceae bacterium]|nr:hypothetical protein [Pirellulaceae bacterium]